MPGRLEIGDPRLRERFAMSDQEFLDLYCRLLEAAAPSRRFDQAHYDRVVGYPWARPPGSYLFLDGEVEELEPDGALDERAGAYLDERIPLLAYGANGAPERLAEKFMALPDGDRDVLVVAGRLRHFDVGVTAIPPVWVSMPGTLVPSPGTAVQVAVLFVSPAQFELLARTELSYLVGELADVEIGLELDGISTTRAFAFVSRFGALGLEGTPVAMAAISADGRTFPALTQIEILDAAARLTLGAGATSIDLVRAAYQDPVAFMADHYAKFQAAATRFESDNWTRLD